MFEYLYFLSNKVHFYSLRINYIWMVYRRALVFHDRLEPQWGSQWSGLKWCGSKMFLRPNLGLKPWWWWCPPLGPFPGPHCFSNPRVHLSFLWSPWWLIRGLRPHLGNPLCPGDNIDLVASHDDQMEIEISVLPVHSGGKVTYVGNDVYNEGDRSS